MPGVPDVVWQTILEKGGVWAALFLLTLFTSATIITVLWRALREAQVQNCDLRTQCAEAIEAVNKLRIDELRQVLNASHQNATIMTEQARAIEARATAISEMAQTLAKLVVIVDSMKDMMRVTTEAVSRFMEIVRPSPQGRNHR